MLEIVSVCGHSFDVLCKIRFNVEPTWKDIQILNDFAPDAKEYLYSKGIQTMRVYTMIMNYGKMC